MNYLPSQDQNANHLKRPTKLPEPKVTVAIDETVEDA